MPEPHQTKSRRSSKRSERSERSESESKASSDRRESANAVSTHKEPKKRGRKIKYTTDEERKEARRQQNRNYRERRREELIKLRRQNALFKELEKEKSLEQN